jgi:hypothetical protein
MKSGPSGHNDQCAVAEAGQGGLDALDRYGRLLRIVVETNSRAISSQENAVLFGATPA